MLHWRRRVFSFALSAALTASVLAPLSNAQSAETLRVEADAALPRAFALGPAAVVPAPSAPAAKATGAAPPASVEGYYLQHARAGIYRLQERYAGLLGFYWSPSFGSAWWVSGNIVAMLSNYTRLSGDKTFLPVLSHTYAFAGFWSPGFLNNFYDDEGWWALGWIAAYDATGEWRYLGQAESIFADMAKGWDKTCGGGIWWSKDRHYKNAIANELFLSVAAELSTRSLDQKWRENYLRWAQAEWAWFSASGMINGQGLINDGLDGSCHNNGQTPWTYNQGVILGGLAELYKAAPDPKLRDAAEAVASAALSSLTDGKGVLREACEPGCSNDGVMFKGAFVRNLMALNDVFPNARYAAFLQDNAASLLNRDRGAHLEFDQSWSGPFKDWNAGTQASALDLLVGAAAASR